MSGPGEAGVSFESEREIIEGERGCASRRLVLTVPVESKEGVIRRFLGAACFRFELVAVMTRGGENMVSECPACEIVGGGRTKSTIASRGGVEELWRPPAPPVRVGRIKDGASVDIRRRRSMKRSATPITRYLNSMSLKVAPN